MERKLLISECIKYQKIVYHPIKKTNFVPEIGSEIFVKCVPIDATDMELVEFFGKVGEIFQLRLMMAENGIENRGFCYVSYMNPEDARKAIDVFKTTAFRPDVYLNVEHSLNNCRIFIGGIPTFKTKDQIWQELDKNGVKNIVDVIMYRSYSNRAENRGFVFVEFKTHEQAAKFRARNVGSLRLWGSPAIVDWSVPIPEIQPSVLGAVKIIYIRNLEVTDPPEKLEKLLLGFVEKKFLEKVYKFKNYAFVHLTTREEAEKLMGLLKDYFKDTVVEIEWAKPPNKFTVPEYRQQKVSGFKSRSRTCSASSNISQKSDRSTSPKEYTSPKPIRLSSESQQESHSLTVLEEVSRNAEQLRIQEPTLSKSHFMNCSASCGATFKGTYNPLCHQITPQVCYPYSFTRPSSCPAGSSLCTGTHLTLPLCTQHEFSVNDNQGPSSYQFPNISLSTQPRSVNDNPGPSSYHCPNISLPSTRIHQFFDRPSTSAMGTSYDYDPVKEYQKRMAELYDDEWRNYFPRTLSDSD